MKVAGLLKQKTLLDTLFLVHAAISIVVGACGIFLPYTFEFFAVPHEGMAERHPSGEGKITHVMIRLYGALVGLQAWFVWNLRKTEDPQLRRNAIAGYAVLFAVSALTLARAQLTEGGGMSVWNWANISVFSLLSAAYAYFAIFLPRSSFESLGRVSS